MAFVAADAAHPDYGNLASLLLAVNEELGYHVREVLTVPGGFDVPDAVKAQLEPEFTPEVPAVAPSGEKLPPPAWWSEPEPEVDVTFEDGKYVVQAIQLDPALVALIFPEAVASVALDGETYALEPEPTFEQEVATAVAAGTIELSSGPIPALDAAGREEIRAWAKENGHQPAAVGKLKLAVIEAFRAAHPDRATAE